jgi:hypothetical protein
LAASDSFSIIINSYKEHNKNYSNGTYRFVMSLSVGIHNHQTMANMMNEEPKEA